MIVLRGEGDVGRFLARDGSGGSGAVGPAGVERDDHEDRGRAAGN